ncbi:MAG: hypothetical protein ACN793_01225 [Buchnera aphidicola (Eriosoma harunire)]
MKNRSIKLNGSHYTMLTLYLFNCDVSIVTRDIKEKINQLPKLFTYAPVIINVARLSNHVDWNHMKKAILSTGLYIVGITECTDDLLKKKLYIPDCL